MTVRKSAGGLLILGAVCALPAGAQVTEIYKCTDESGRPLYTSDKRDTRGRKCELVSRQVNVVPAPAPRKPFPKETVSQRETAKVRQREILEKELAAEQQLLANAQKALEEQEAVRTGGEKNYARVLERLQPYKDSVETHQKNIEALQRELSNLSR